MRYRSIRITEELSDRFDKARDGETVQDVLTKLSKGYVNRHNRKKEV